MNPAGPIHDDLVTYSNKWSFRSSDPANTWITAHTGLDLPETDSRLLYAEAKNRGILDH